MAQEMKGKKVAFVATDGVEQAELLKPKEALDAAGAQTHVISQKSGEIKGWDMKEWGQKIKVDKTFDDAKPADYDLLVLPGGVMNPDKLRMDPKAVSFVKEYVQSGKPVAAICHASWTLIEADAVRGRKMTSWPSLKTDLKNAGANWVDEQVVIDKNFITSRNPDDIPAFNKAILGQFGELALKAAS